ncbi:DNA polymerase X family [hydrothermal vent metagenome]|uniref:DNA polymerase X family n=1 Tax=hydrothermal vent metagenome TaxID=652676 RepID=A0A3B1DJD4_9ZZZZ
MELHNENDFKIKSYHNAVYNLERTNQKLTTLSLQDIELIEGVGKGIAQIIDEINQTGNLGKLNELKRNTPKGILKLMKLRGIGSKKLKTLWSELGVDSADLLAEEIAKGNVQKLKGFGNKTVENISEILVFAKEAEGYIHYADAENLAIDIKTQIESSISDVQIEFAGKLRRKWEIINQLEFVVAAESPMVMDLALLKFESIQKTPSKSGLFTWRGVIISNEPVEVVFHFSTKEKFHSTLLLKTGSQAHLTHTFKNGSLKKTAESNTFNSEEEIYKALDLTFCEPEIREGNWELDFAENNELPTLVELQDITGAIHNHSKYSDGENTLEEMAVFCQQQGYQYLGISDHSKATSFYANGMFEETVKKQHLEIDALNKNLAPFKIFKGIEADILADGSLDYDNETLASFDFVVASIHSGLNMDITKATNRLLTAIANPHTTMLGHITGRLLLARKGYPINHKIIIDACATYGVIIEINAHPKRLDIDWRWINYALDQGVLLSINPDAHATDGFKDMYYGVCVGRKGGLTKEQTLNTWSTEKIETYFNERKLKIKS